MSIVQLKKITLYGSSLQKSSTLDGLQRLGCLHLINLSGGETPPRELVSREAREALRYLDTASVQRRLSRHDTDFDSAALIRQVLEIKEQQEKLTEELDFLRAAVRDLEPWGEFQLPPVEPLGGPQFWFYIVPLRQVDQIPENLTWKIAARDHRFAYVVVLAQEPPEELRFPRVELDPRPLSVLRQRVETVEEELEKLRWERVSLTRWRKLLKRDLNEADDRAARLAAAERTFDDQQVFAVQGWIPQAAIADVQEYARQQGLAVTIDEPTEADKPPTLLRNPERVAGAEGCVTFYITPGYFTWDPTTIVFFSFSIFFAIIVADAGYGLIMAALLLMLWRKLGATRQGRQGRNLITGIVLATVVYGVIVGSYFGISPPAESFLGKLVVRVNGKPLMENQNLMMVLSVTIGVFHLVLANLISTWNRRGSLRALGHFGWALLMVGGLTYGIAGVFTEPALESVAKQLLIVSAVLILLFSSEQSPLTYNPLTHLKRLGEGIVQFTKLSSAFGDALSYLRLFALGLASAQLAVTFNNLASQAAQSKGIGLLLAILILLVGHGINFVLGLMGGVVHGLRLNCIEFFNWSLTDEGYGYQPFTKKAES